MVGTVVEYISLSNACSSVTIATCRHEFDYVKNCVFCDQAMDCCIEGIVCVRCFFIAVLLRLKWRECIMHASSFKLASSLPTLAGKTLQFSVGTLT